MWHRVPVSRRCLLFRNGPRNRKIELCGVKNDATTFIEAWVTQNEYINPRNMEQMRSDVLDIKKLAYPRPKL